MTPVLWGTVAVFVLGVAALVLTRLPRHQLPAMLVLAGAAGLAALRQFPLAMMLAAVGVGLWRRASAAGPPSPGQTSEIHTRGLAMTLDHDSGVMEGEVLAGPFADRRLSDLSADELQQLVEQFEVGGDEESLALLLAWLDRHDRAAGASGHDARREAHAGPPPSGGPMTEAEAYRVLGLAPGASVEEVRESYRRLMRRVHPDLGGSSALAAMLNAAKEVLDPG